MLTILLWAQRKPASLCPFFKPDSFPQESFSSKIDDVKIALGEENENLQTLNESITSTNWTVVEDDFTIFLLSNQPYIAEKIYSNPLIALDDGFLDLQYMHNVSYF